MKWQKGKFHYDRQYCTCLTNNVSLDNCMVGALFWTLWGLKGTYGIIELLIKWMNEHINNDGTTSHLALLHPSKNLFHCFYYFIHFAFSNIRIHFYICVRGYIIINNAKLASTWARFRLSASSGTSQFFQLIIYVHICLMNII